MNEEVQKRSMPYPLSCPYPMQVHSHKGEIYPLIANKIPLKMMFDDDVSAKGDVDETGCFIPVVVVDNED